MIDHKDCKTQSDLWKELEKACYEYDFKKRKFCTAVIGVCEDSKFEEYSMHLKQNLMQCW